jgi:hypothetical protein
LRNLRALCQRCHMLHDRPHHLAQRRITYRQRLAVGDLFLGRCGSGACSWLPSSESPGHPVNSPKPICPPPGAHSTHWQTICQ